MIHDPVIKERRLHILGFKNNKDCQSTRKYEWHFSKGITFYASKYVHQRSIEHNLKKYTYLCGALQVFSVFYGRHYVRRIITVGKDLWWCKRRWWCRLVGQNHICWTTGILQLVTFCVTRKLSLNNWRRAEGNAQQVGEGR